MLKEGLVLLSFAQHVLFSPSSLHGFQPVGHGNANLDSHFVPAPLHLSSSVGGIEVKMSLMEAAVEDRFASLSVNSSFIWQGIWANCWDGISLAEAGEFVWNRKTPISTTVIRVWVIILCNKAIVSLLLVSSLGLAIVFRALIDGSKNRFPDYTKHWW
jgi:hypothetical protein